MSNQEEYLAGTDPTNALSFLRVELNATNRQATVRFPAVSNKTYTVLFTDHASLDGWRKLADVLARTNNRMETLVDRNWTTNPLPSRYTAPAVNPTSWKTLLDRFMASFTLIPPLISALIFANPEKVPCANSAPASHSSRSSQ